MKLDSVKFSQLLNFSIEHTELAEKKEKLKKNPEKI